MDQIHFPSLRLFARFFANAFFSSGVLYVGCNTGSVSLTYLIRLLAMLAALFSSMPYRFKAFSHLPKTKLQVRWIVLRILPSECLWSATLSSGVIGPWQRLQIPPWSLYCSSLYALTSVVLRRFKVALDQRLVMVRRLHNWIMLLVSFLILLKNNFSATYRTIIVIYRLSILV